MAKRRKLSTGMRLTTGFILIILTGAVLLFLPISHKQGMPVTALDALFVSVSAVCVTGLTTVPVGATFTIFGKVVLCFLM